LTSNCKYKQIQKSNKANIILAFSNRIFFNYFKQTSKQTKL